MGSAYRLLLLKLKENISILTNEIIENKHLIQFVSEKILDI